MLLPLLVDLAPLRENLEFSNSSRASSQSVKSTSIPLMFSMIGSKPFSRINTTFIRSYNLRKILKKLKPFHHSKIPLPPSPWKR
jgi:hypothetical protein